MPGIESLRRALATRLLEGDGRATKEMRREAFELGTKLPDAARALVAKVAARAHEVRDEDVAAARAAGLTEDEIFEVVVCAAVGEATREHEAALAALAAGSESEKE